jgi:hypothetical protein
LEDKIKEDKASKKTNHGQINKWKKTTMGALEHLAEKKEEHAGEALKTRVKWTLGFDT